MTSFTEQFLLEIPEYGGDDEGLQEEINRIALTSPGVYEEPIVKEIDKFNSPKDTEPVVQPGKIDKGLFGVDVESSFKYNGYDNKDIIEKIITQMNIKKTITYSTIIKSVEYHNLESTYRAIDTTIEPYQALDNYIQLCTFFPKKFLKYTIGIKNLATLIKEYYNVIAYVQMNENGYNYHILLSRNSFTDELSLNALGLTQSMHVETYLKDLLETISKDLNIDVPNFKPVDHSHYMYFSSFIQTLQKNSLYNYIIQYLMVLGFIISYEPIEIIPFVTNFLLHMINRPVTYEPNLVKGEADQNILKKLKIQEDHQYYHNEGIDNVNKDYIYPNRKMNLFMNNLCQMYFLAVSGLPYWHYLFDIDYRQFNTRTQYQDTVRLTKKTVLKRLDYRGDTIINTLLMNNKPVPDKDNVDFKKITDDIINQLKKINIDPSVKLKERLVHDKWREPIFNKSDAPVYNLRQNASAKNINIQKEIEIIIQIEQPQEAPLSTKEKPQEEPIIAKPVNYGITKKSSSKTNVIPKGDEERDTVRQIQSKQIANAENKTLSLKNVEPIVTTTTSINRDDKFKFTQNDFNAIKDVSLFQHNQDIQTMVTFYKSYADNLIQFNINDKVKNVKDYYTPKIEARTNGFSHNAECGFFILCTLGKNLSKNIVHYNNISLIHEKLYFFVKVYSLTLHKIDTISQKEMINDLLVSYYLRQVSSKNFLNIIDWYVCNLTVSGLLPFYANEYPSLTIKKPEFLYIGLNNIMGDFQFKVYEKKTNKSVCTPDLFVNNLDTFLYEIFSILLSLEKAYSKTGFIHNNLYVRYTKVGDPYSNGFANNVTESEVPDIKDRNLCFKSRGGKDLYRFNSKQHLNIVVKISNFEKSRIKTDKGAVINNIIDSPFIDQKTLIGSIIQNVRNFDVKSFYGANKIKWDGFRDFCNGVLGLDSWRKLIEPNNDIYSLEYKTLLTAVGRDKLNQIDIDSLIGLNYFIDAKKLSKNECQGQLDKILYRASFQEFSFKNYGFTLQECIDHHVFNIYKSETTEIKEDDIVLSE